MKTKNQQSPSSKSGTDKELVRDLRAQRSAAVAAELAEQPWVALAAVAYAMASEVFYVATGEPGTYQVFCSPRRPGLPEGSIAWESIEQERLFWEKRLPQGKRLWRWCLSRPADTLLELLAFCAAVMLDFDGHEERILEDALNLDMRGYFIPKAENYFRHLSKQKILDALADICGVVDPDWAALTKHEIAALAQREADRTAWLPEALRRPLRT